MASLGSLVIELAANTARLQGDLGRGVGMLQTFATRAKSTLGVFGLAGAGGLLGALVKDATNFGDQISKASKLAGTGAGLFSELAAAAKQVDVDIGTLSKGLRTLQANVSEAAKGSKAAQSTFRDLGLDFENLVGLAPDRQLQKVADALRRVGQEDKARLGAEALGKSYAELLPLLDEGGAGLRKMVEEQRKLGNTFTDKQIKQLADTDDAIKKMTSSWTSLGRTLVGFVAPGLERVARGLTAAVTQGGADEVRFLEAQIKSREALRARASGLGDDAGTKLLREQLRLARERELVEKRLGALSRGGGLFEQVEEDRRRREEARQAQIEAFEPITTMAKRIEITPFKQFYEQLDALTQTNEEKTIASFRAQEAALNELFAAGKISAEQFNARSEQLLNDTLPKFSTSVNYIVKDFHKMSEFAKEASRNMQSAFADFLFDPFEDGVKGMLRSFTTALRRMVAEAAAAKFLGPKSEGGLGLGDLVTAGLTKLIGFAEGGRPPVGRASIVGERGPELFIPDRAGTVIPNHALVGPGRGSSITIVNHNTFTAGSDVELRRAMPAMLQKAMDGAVGQVRVLRDRGRL